MNEDASAKFRVFQLLRWPRSVFVTAILIMNSIFLGMMNSHDLPVNRNIVIAEGFAAAAAVWGCIEVESSGFFSLIVVLIQVFIMAGYIFIATVYEPALRDCKSYADTPFRDIIALDGLPSVRDSCGMQAANFALSIIVV